MLRRTAHAGENLNFREAGCLLATIVTRTPPRHSMNYKNKAGTYGKPLRMAEAIL